MSVDFFCSSTFPNACEEKLAGAQFSYFLFFRVSLYLINEFHEAEKASTAIMCILS
jgi:hypothetical protein